MRVAGGLVGAFDGWEPAEYARTTRTRCDGCGSPALIWAPAAVMVSRVAGDDPEYARQIFDDFRAAEARPTSSAWGCSKCGAYGVVVVPAVDD